MKAGSIDSIEEPTISLLAFTFESRLRHCRFHLKPTFWLPILKPASMKPIFSEIAIMNAEFC